jgi:hypothetical protein
MERPATNQTVQVTTEPYTVKERVLRSFEDKWGDELKVVLHSLDVRELFSDIAHLVDKVVKKPKQTQNPSQNP